MLKTISNPLRPVNQPPSLLFAVFVPLALTAQFAPTINETTVIVSTPPRYELWQGVDVAIQNVQKLGKPLILKNVLAEIDRMVGANDIRRPYRYNFSSSFSFNGRKAKGRSNRTLDADNKKKKAEFEQGVARRISQMTGKSIEDVGEPVPSRYTTKDEFVRAYVNAKMQDVDDETRKKYSRKIVSCQTQCDQCSRIHSFPSGGMRPVALSCSQRGRSHRQGQGD